MDFYKKLIKSNKLRFRILAMLHRVPDVPMLKLQYRVKCGRKLDLEAPKRYTEKMQWFKLYYRHPDMPQCADKLQVREYIKSKGLGELLNDLYAVFETPEQIDLEVLPEKFILKLSNGSSTNLLCLDKNELDLEAVKQKFRDFQAQRAAFAGREWVYSRVKSVIIAEQVLEDESQKNGALRDYKILCFQGKPEYIICVDGRHTDHYCHLVYDTAWKKQNVTIGKSSSAGECPRPENLDRMLQIAGILSADFPAARIDLYSVSGKIYFGEITFFPWSGYMQFTPDSFDRELGDKFVLPEKNHNEG